MTEFGIVETKSRLSELIERAARGEDIVITRGGIADARLMLPPALDARGQAFGLVARIRHSRTAYSLSGAVSTRHLREEGRR